MASICFHCGLNVPAGTCFQASIDGQMAEFCCPGCEAVAMAIVDGGLEHYYQYRTANNLKPASEPQRFDVFDNPVVQEDFVDLLDNGRRQAHLLIEGISCAACVWLLEKHLQRLAGVETVQVNASTHRAHIIWQADSLGLSVIMAAINEIGYQPLPATQNQQQQLRQRESRLALMRLAVAGFGMMQVGMAAVALYAGAGDEWLSVMRWLSLLMATPVVLFSAQPFFRAALRSLVTRHLTMDVPVALAIGGAYLASLWATVRGGGEVYFDSVSMFTFFLLLGRFLEMRIRHRNGLSHDSLSQLVPLAATRIAKHPSIDERLLPAVTAPAADVFLKDLQRDTVAVRELQVGDWVEVAGGDNIPCDGEVVAGTGTVDESLLTGEADPVHKQPGDPVVAGSLNLGQRLIITVNAVGRGTRLNAIERLVEQGRQHKPAQVALADQVAGYFVAAVLLVSVVVASVWWQIDADKAIWVTLSVLVVTCPCALSLATPTALTAALNRLRHDGLLITRGHVLETLQRVNHIVFDKTGTLTEGRPQLQRVTLTDAGLALFAAGEVDASRQTKAENSVLAIVAALESGSRHPIAWAFRRWQGQLFARGLEQHVGQGVVGEINGRRWRFGKADFVTSAATATAEFKSGEQCLFLALDDGALIACVFLRDSLRSQARQTVAQLQKKGITLSLVSGDHADTVMQLASDLGIELVVAGASPEQKLAYLEEAQASGDTVMMVGDGINDVPVLSAADVSVAMGSATDLAKAQADSILLNGDLNVLPQTLVFAQQVRKVIRQNLAWALAYNGLALPLAALGWIPPYLAAAGMSASSLVVVINALRLNRAVDTERPRLLQTSTSSAFY